MQKVSSAYRESMASIMREQGYIKIIFGLVNQEAQTKSTIANGSYTYYSNTSSVFTNGNDSRIYATLEEGFSKVDGTMYFLPKSTSGQSYYNTGVISNALVSSGNVSVTINLNAKTMDVKGLSIDFGENYPTAFDVISSSGAKVSYTNDQSVWSTEDVITNTTSIKLVIKSMKNKSSRLRIYSITFGYGLVYGNDDITGSSLQSYVSPIGADVPQVDFSVTLQNYDRYFDVDNPHSAINYLETGQEMDVMYGYATPGSDEIEWIQGQHLVCSEWEADDTSATIKCQDVLRNMDEYYSNGNYSDKGATYYSLAKAVFEDADISHYYIDPRLKKLKTKIPLPYVKHKEALQIIANACRCSLLQDRNGIIRIKSNFLPDISIASNNFDSRFDIENILSTDGKKEYANLSNGYIRVDNTMYIADKNTVYESGATVYSALSNGSGTFSSNPSITLTMDAIRAYYELKLNFAEDALPSQFTIQTYNGKTAVNKYEIQSDEISRNTVISRRFDDCDKIVITFTKTFKANGRIGIQEINLSDAINFTMNSIEMSSAPTSIKQEKIKSVIVYYYTYKENSAVDSVINDEVDAEEGETETFYFTDACYGYSATLNNKAENVKIVKSGAHFVTVKYNITKKEADLNIKGYFYKIATKRVRRNINARGKTIVWENPMIDSKEMATDLANWLVRYYSSSIEYDYDTRGNPELDPFDIVFQENRYVNNMKINIYDIRLDFKTSFSGHITARREVD